MTLKKSGVITVFEYLLMLSTVLYSSVWALFTSAQSNTFSRVFIVILGVLLALRFTEIRQRGIYRAAAMAIFIVVFMFFTRYNLIRTVLYLLIPFCLSILYLSLLKTREEKSRLILYLSDILVALSFVSLVLYILGTLFGFLSPTSQVRVWWAEEERVINTYFHLLYEAQEINFFGHTFMRNCGIFPEAPGFAAFLSVSLAAELFLRKRLSRSRIIILTLTCISTFSAKALLLAAAAFALKFLFWENKSRLVTIAKALGAALAAAFAALILWDKAQSPSFYIRLDDFQAALAAFAQNPIFGAGYYNDSAVIANFEYAYRYNDGLSMGIAVLAAQGGLWLILFYLLSSVKAVLCTQKGERASCVSFALIFFGMLFITNMPFAMITIFIVSYFGSVGEEGFFEKLWEGVKGWLSKA